MGEKGFYAERSRRVWVGSAFCAASARPDAAIANEKGLQVSAVGALSSAPMAVIVHRKGLPNAP